MHDTVYLYSIMNGDMVCLNAKPRLGTMQRMCKALRVTLTLTLTVAG
jgi:hypothetical protein